MWEGGVGAESGQEGWAADSAPGPGEKGWVTSISTPSIVYCQSLQGLLCYLQSVLIFHLSDIGGFVFMDEKNERIPTSRKTKCNFHRLFLNGYGEN